MLGGKTYKVQKIHDLQIGFAIDTLKMLLGKIKEIHTVDRRFLEKKTVSTEVNENFFAHMRMMNVTLTP